MKAKDELNNSAKVTVNSFCLFVISLSFKSIKKIGFFDISLLKFNKFTITENSFCP